MIKDRYSYVAFFDYAEDGINIEFPDLEGCYPCADKDDTDIALKNAWGSRPPHLGAGVGCLGIKNTSLISNTLKEKGGSRNGITTGKILYNR